MGESFRNLAVWQRSVDLTLEIYKLTASFPDSERYGLTNQLRRAAVSVASNIAEGYAVQPGENTFSSWATPVVRIPKWKHRLSLQKRSASAHNGCSKQQKNHAVR